MGNEKIEITEGLLVAYINNDLNPEEAEQVLAWIKAEPKNAEAFKALQKAWDMTGTVQPKPVSVNRDLAWEKVQKKIALMDSPIVPIKRLKSRKIYWAAAAMIIALLGVFSVLRLSNSNPENITRFAANSGLIDHLSDGSVVTLNANSSIIYPKAFAENERRITLKGEAFFEIERDVGKPFIVELPENAYVKVLGTSFNIRAVDGDSLISVYVKTGKVEFGTDSSHIILEAGQKGVMNVLTGDVYENKDKSNEVNALFWLNGELNFDGTPLYEVVEILNDLFSNPIILACDEAKDLPIRSPHKKGESLQAILEVIASTHGLRLDQKKVDGQNQFILSCNAL